MNSFFSWIYNYNYRHDQMESYNRHHEIIQLSGLVMVISLMFPMAICLDTGLDYSRTAWLMFAICMAIACSIRIPYKMGKLNKYAPQKSFQEKESLQDLLQKLKTIREELEDLQKSKIYESKKKENFYSYNTNSPSRKAPVSDWRIPHLKVLGLNSTATTDDIKKMYRKLAMKWHPDRNKSSNAEETFKKIKSAYEKLC